MGPLLEPVSASGGASAQGKGRAEQDLGRCSFQLTLVAPQQLLELSQPFQGTCPGESRAQDLPEHLQSLAAQQKRSPKHSRGSPHTPDPSPASLAFILTNKLQVPTKSSLTKTDPTDRPHGSEPGCVLLSWESTGQAPTGSVPARTFF